MDEQIVSWQVARERLTYRYLAALEEGDIATVLAILAKAEQDAILEEMLWQVHAENLQDELDFAEPESARQALPEELQTVEEESVGSQDGPLYTRAPQRSRRVPHVLQMLAAILAVCVLVGGFLLVLSGHRQSTPGSGPRPFGCFVSVPAPHIHGVLRSVAAVAEDNIWAVGEQDEDDRVSTALIEHWNGQHWQTVANPNVSGMSSALSSVTAISATDIWAVGQIAKQSSGSGFAAQTLVEHWDGQNWRIIPSKNLVRQGMNTLASITAVAADDIWAVGTAETMQTSSQPGQPHLRTQELIEHWDGQNWQIVPAPQPGAEALESDLTGVIALAKNNVWAVGSNNSRPLIEHWDGRVWSQIASPGPSEPGNLTGISAVSANDAWAVGDNGAIEHWDGRSWRIIASASQFTLNAVLALAPDDVWVVGHAHRNMPEDTLIEHWDGKNWRVVTSPDPGAGQQRENDLEAIAATSAGKIWVVGFQQISPGTVAPLIMASSCL